MEQNLNAVGINIPLFWVENYTRNQSTCFENTFFAILRTSLASVFIYFRKVNCYTFYILLNIRLIETYFE